MYVEKQILECSKNKLFPHKIIYIHMQQYKIINLNVAVTAMNKVKK